MSLIRLNDDFYINPEDVISVEVYEPSQRVVVRLRNGHDYSVAKDYGKGVYATRDRIVNEINKPKQ